MKKQNTLNTSTASPLFVPLALGAAFLLGGLHALAPGHNKTLTGAYLVGAQARLRHAVLIGAATALSHTASTAVLGVLALSTAGQLASVDYLRWIGLPSGILTVFLGFWLLRRQLRATHASDHDHNHESTHQQGRSNHHDHAHHHGHDHGHLSPDQVTLGGLVAMGLAHGIVPTFDAMAILLVALTVKQVILGIGLITVYSLGIACVLIAIGALFISTQKLLLDHPRFDRLTHRAPLFAAALVILLGSVLFIRALSAL